MSVRALGSDWTMLAADVLGIPSVDVARHAATTPFLSLGGTSLRATAFAALVERHLGRRVDLHALLGRQPLAEVVAAAPPSTQLPPVVRPSATDASIRMPNAGQEAMILGEQVVGGSQFHLLFSADLRGPLDEDRLVAALATLTARHEALRSIFVEHEGELRVRVLREWRPRVLRIPSPTLAEDPIATIHAQLATASTTLLRPMERPPVVFALTRLGPDRSVLSFLIHHAIADGWSMGLLWQDLLEAYAATPFTRAAFSPDLIVTAESALSTRGACRTRLAELGDAPLNVDIAGELRRPDIFDRRGVRLHFGLGPEARDACTRLLRACGVTRNVVLLAAWGLVVSRRAGAADFLIGVSSAGRNTADLHGVVGLCTKLMPVRIRPDSADSVRTYIDGVGAEFRRGLAAGGVPIEMLAGGLRAPRDPSRPAIIQIGFAAHDELIPAGLEADGLTLTLHEGHCGGTAFDAILFVQRWGDRPVLALEYAGSVFTPAEAGDLAREIEEALVELASDLDAALSAVPAVGAAGRERLARLGAGTPVDAETDIWQLVEDSHAKTPDAPAVRDIDGRILTYSQLRAAVVAQAAALRRAGVGAGDHVALVLDRAATEIVAVLATLRLGAAYVALDTAMPTAVLSQVIDLIAPRALLATGGADADLAMLAPEMMPVALLDPWAAPLPGAADTAAPVDPGAVAYVAFTSGSTGRPKGVRVPHRAVVRLVRDPGLLVDGATDRFMRFAPLAFDASTLEIFAPLATGGCVEIYPEPHAMPTSLATFLREREVTAAWLTSGLFRLVADDRPDAFAGLRQLLTGGDVVPPPQATRVLAHCPGLRLTNGYGPSENTTFTTTYDADSEADIVDPLPIGRPIAGTQVLVADDEGRPVPPGAVGELWTSGDGVAVDYLGAPEETARAFVRLPGGPRYYRTGDLVRWNGDGDLVFVGRRDGQIKVRGFRVELSAVTEVLRGHPAVADAAVVASAGSGADKQLVAGVVPGPGGVDVVALQAYAAKRLPSYAVPVLWAVVDALPVSRNGKLDVRQLVEVARANVGATAGH